MTSDWAYGSKAEGLPRGPWQGQVWELVQRPTSTIGDVTSPEGRCFNWPFPGVVSVLPALPHPQTHTHRYGLPGSLPLVGLHAVLSCKVVPSTH